METAPDNGTELRCLFIGPLANHAVVGRVAALIAAGCDVHLVNASSVVADWLRCGYPVSRARIIGYVSDPLHRGESQARQCMLEYLRSLGWIPENRQLAAHVRSIIREVEPSVAVVHFGADAIHYARILKRIEPRLAVIDIINLLPAHVDLRSGLSRLLRGWSGRIEDHNYRHWLKRLDGIVYASEEMRDYAAKTLGVQGTASAIMPDYLPLGFQGQAPPDAPVRQASGDGDPRVVFLGSPERYGAKLDSIDDQFMELANEHIHAYSGAISEEVVATGFGHRYPSFSDHEVFAGRLAEFAFQFDAALLTYNVPRRQERFRSTYPTRFFTALTAGIPIAVRAGLFDACERFVADHENGFVYVSASDLRAQLLDRGQLSRYRANARASRRSMNAEMQGEELRSLIELAIERAVTDNTKTAGAVRRAA